MVAPIRFLSGRQQQQKIGVIGSTEDTKVLEVIGRVGIGTVIFDPIEQFDLNDGNAIFRNSVGIGTTNIFSGGNTNSLTLDGKIVVGNAIGSTNLSNVISPNVGTGVNAYRAFNLVDTSSVVKIVRASSFTAGPAIELQHWDENIDTQYGYWDLISESGHFAFRDRLIAGDKNRIFISNNGNVLIGSNSGNIGISSDESVGFGTDNVFQVNGNVYLGGDVGIGTTSPTADLDVVGLTELDNLNVSGIATIGTFGVSGLTTTNSLIVSGIATFRNNVEFFGPSSVQLTWDSVEDILRFKDDVAAYFGDDGDLRIFHNGSDSYISDSGTGNIKLISDGLGVVIQKSGTESIANFNTDGSVELYYANSKKFETTGIGVSIVNGTSDTATIAGPENLIIDPAAVGDNTGLVRIKGDLYVDGTTTQINSTTIELADFIVGIATTATSDLLADGAGIQIGPDNKFLYEYNGGTNPSLKSSENLNVASGKVYQIAETERLSANTLSLGTGTTIHSPGSDELIFGTNGQERVRIDSSGDVGIGTNAPIAKLDVRGTVNVTGVSTFASAVDINAGLDVDGFTELDATNISETLNVVGLSTFASNVDINADLDVDGHTELDDLNVSGVSTFASNVDINADLDVDGRTELDTTNISETLNVVGISTFLSDIDIDASIDVDGHTELDDLNVSGVSTFASSVDINADLDVDGRTELDTTNISETLNVVGLSTFGSDVDINASVDISTNLVVDGLSDLDELNVAGLSTFASNVDINADLDVDGFTELDATNISETLNVVGLSTFASNVDINAGLDVDGFTELDATNISETLNVVGLSTFGSNVDINAGLDVDGHTELDTLNVSIATTTASLTLANAGVAVTAILDEDGLTSDRADALATQQSIKAYVDAQVTAQDLDIQGDTGGALSIDLDSEVLTIAGTASEIETSGSGNTITIGLPNQVAITTSLVVGSGVTITGSTVQVGGTITELYNGTFWNVVTQADVGYGASQVPLNQYLGQLAFLDDYHPNGLRRDGGGSDDVFVDSNGLVGINTTSPTSTLDVNGTLNVAGISTFASDIDINADLDVDGYTELDSTNISETLNVVGLTTLGSNVDINASVDISGNLDVHTDLDVDGYTELDSTNISETLNVVGLSTFGSNVDINADLDVDGRTELDDLNVSGVSTFASNVDINAGLDVDGHTELDNLNVTGVATFTSNVNISTGELHGPAEFIIDPAAVGDNTGLVRIKGDLYVDGTTTQINSTTIEFADFNVGIATTVGTNLLLDGAGISIGSASVEKTFTYNNSANTLESSIGLGVTTGGDFKTGTDSVLNRTTLGTTVVNSSLTSVGTLTEVEVSGISTFGSNVDINASVDISTNLVVDGLSDLDELNVAGISTFASDLDINASVDISNNLVVDGLSDLDELNVAGVSTFQDSVYLGDADVLHFGDNNDLRIYHSGNESWVRDTGTGNLLIDTNGDSIRIISDGSTVNGKMAYFNKDGSVELYYDNSKKFETTADGVTVSGGVYVSGISTFQNNIEVTGNIEFDNITTTGAATATLSTLTETAIHTGLSASTYRSVEYTIQATEGTNFHSAKVLVVHDGTTAYHSEYGTIYNNTPVATFNADVSGGNLRLLAAGESSNSTVYKIHFIATKV